MRRISAEEVERLARRVWFGRFPQMGDRKFADLSDVGVNGRQAEWDIPTYQEVQVGKFRVYLETGCRGDFRGRIHVKKR